MNISDCITQLTAIEEFLKDNENITCAEKAQIELLTSNIRKNIRTATTDVHYCQYVITRGKNKGENCRHITKNGDKFCSRHTKSSESSVSEEEQCCYIYMRGEHKGKKCTRKILSGCDKCSRHKNSNEKSKKSENETAPESKTKSKTKSKTTSNTKSRPLSAYNIFMKELKVPDNEPRMSYGSKMWATSFLNKKSENYDEQKTKDYLNKYNSDYTTDTNTTDTNTTTDTSIPKNKTESKNKTKKTQKTDTTFCDFVYDSGPRNGKKCPLPTVDGQTKCVKHCE